MYNSTNLSLSPLKVVKKSIGTLFFTTIVGALFIAFGIFFQSLSDNTAADMQAAKWLILGGVFWIIFWFLPILIWQYLYYKLYYYNFEDGGAEIRKGVISRATGHVRYERLQNIYLDQDVLDRIFGLYNIHYETAGEVSGFYSHVDGLNKENADKLVAFLNDRAKGGQGQYNATGQFDASDVANNIAQSSGHSIIELSRENCPISSKVIYERTLMITGIMFVLIFSIVFGFISNNLEVKTKFDQFERDGNFLGFIIAMIPYGLPYLIAILVIFLIYNIVWYRNFYFSFGSERGEIKSKVIGQSISYLYYDRIQNINISQMFIERLFGIYTLIIETAGETSGTKLTLQGFTRENAERIRDFLLGKAKRYKRL